MIPETLILKGEVSIDDAGTVTGIAWPFGSPNRTTRAYPAPCMRASIVRSTRSCPAGPFVRPVMDKAIAGVILGRFLAVAFLAVELARQGADCL